MKKFKYGVGGLSENATTDEQMSALNKMGDKGFDLCSVFHMGRGKNSGYLFFYFKKEIASKKSNIKGEGVKKNGKQNKKIEKTRN